MNWQEAVAVALEADNLRQDFAQSIVVDLMVDIGKNSLNDNLNGKLTHLDLTQANASEIRQILKDKGIFVTVEQFEEEPTGLPGRIYLTIAAMTESAVAKSRKYYKVLAGANRVELPREFLEQAQRIEVR